MVKISGIVALLSLFLLFSECGEVPEVQEILTEDTNKETVYYNSRKNAHIQSITLIEQSDYFEVLISTSDGENSYKGKKVGDEIVISQEGGRDLHMYRNGEFELRVYVVSREDSLPEDMEWTFYNNM